MKKTITYPATLDNLENMLDSLMDLSPHLSIEKKELGKLRLVMEEALVNIIKYAYPDTPGEIDIAYEIDDHQQLTIQLTDQGLAFNPLQKDDPDITLPMEEREIGGLGIFMIKQIMDQIDYKREDNCNILIMKKKYV